MNKTNKKSHFLSSVFSSLSSSSSEGKSAVMSDDSLGGGSLPGQTHVRAKICKGIFHTNTTVTTRRL